MSNTSKFIEIIKSQSVYSFVENPIPVFYILFAYYNRIRLHIRENEVVELSDIPDHVELSFYRDLKKASESCMLTHPDYFMRLMDYLDESIKFDYAEAVESLVSLLSNSTGKYANTSFSKELMEIIAHLIFIANGDERYILDLYGGCGSALMMEDEFPPIAFNRIDSWTPILEYGLISKVRASLHRLTDCSVEVGNTMPRRNNTYTHLLYNSPNTWSVETISDVLDFFMEGFDENAAAILHLPARFCYSPEYREIRGTMVESNLLSMVILLPTGTITDLQDSSVMVLLRKDKEDDSATFVDSRPYYTGGKFLVTEFCKDLWACKSERHSDSFSSLDLKGASRTLLELCLHPLMYTANDTGLDTGDKVSIEAPSLFSISIGNADYSEGIGVVIARENYVDTNNALFDYTNSIERSIPEGYLQHSGKSLVISTAHQRFELAVISSNISFYAKPEDVVLSFNGPLANGSDIMYFAHFFLAHPHIQAAFLLCESYGSLKEFLDRTTLCVFFDKEDIENYIKDLRWKYLFETRKESEGKRVTSELKHMLSLNFDSINEMLKDLKLAYSTESASSELQKLECNINYIDRIITAYNSDFIRTSLKPQYVNDFMKSYITAWESLGRKGFTLEFITSLDDSVKAQLDDTQMYVMLDTILENARKHGFNKKAMEGNLVQIVLGTKMLGDNEYISIKVQNNGAKLPENFSLDQYIRKGDCVGKQAGSGIGGYHIYRIVQNHNGLLSIESDEKWGAIIEILIPVEL